MELRPQQPDQPIDRIACELHLVIEGLLGAQHEETVALHRHDAFEKHEIESRRVCQRLAQSGGRRHIERQRAIAALQVKVEERDAAVLAIGEIPGEVGRDRRRADAAPRADQRDEFREAMADRSARLPRPQIERLGERLRRDRLDDVIMNAGMHQVAIQRDVVVVADSDNGDTRLAHLGELLDACRRHLDAADIDNQRFGRALTGEKLDCLDDAAAHDRRVRERERRQGFLDIGLGLTVGDKRQ